MTESNAAAASSTKSSFEATCQEKNQKSGTRARLVSPNDLAACGARLRNGDLVAFPTETVYGLGCHALDADAVSKVFQAKERPLTDPLIVHVVRFQDAQPLWRALPDSAERQTLKTLCDSFWPGPLTLVAKASADVPPILMANTGFVACRAPSLKLARDLLREAKVPIAAPSANKFGHVSPTRAQHVLDDLKWEDVWILDSPVVCHVGVESTVAKVEFANDSSEKNNTGTITILRQGAVSSTDMEICLTKAGLIDTCTVVSSTCSTTTEQEAVVSPGQLIRHYSPNVPSYMLSAKRYQNGKFLSTEEDREVLSTVVVVDFGGRLRRCLEWALAYRDLSLSGDSSEAAQTVFEALRWAEQIEGATRIVFPEIIVAETTDALTLALKDRLTRAASGVLIEEL